ncbi:universal stress protein [Thermococcus gorgonarius]|uniref:Universal stress protein n=1 Tax=Thermococcus gorgonarius TaxID=71997 RepID=A0A2Z2M6Q8_THEGO|nr:universal stress protein [Thermococcus gorgonarius]ASJ01336.1 universal stress protein [Thermococcus gorgonarius]
MFEKVLYPTDFSEVSLKVLRECLPELKTLGAKEFHILHIVDITLTEFEAFTLQEIYREKIKDLKKELEEKGLKVRTEVKIGIPSVEIAEYAEKEGVDLIITPSVGQNIWRRMFVGSTASNLARTTRRPVLVLKYVQEDEEYKPTFDSCLKIFLRPLVAIDFSRCSLRIVETVKKFEELTEKIILLHSVDYGSIDEIETNIKLAEKNLEKTSKAFKRPVEKEVMVGTASQAIIGTSIAKRATLVVIGKKGRSFLKDLLLGSTAERVLRDSKLPVLLVPCE